MAAFGDLAMHCTGTFACIKPFFQGDHESFDRIHQKNSLFQLTAVTSMGEVTAYAKAGEIAQEVFGSLRTVLAFNGGSFEQKR